MPLEAGTVVGSYVVEALLGTGGMASVYRVRHRVLDSVHALKVLSPDLVGHRGVRDRFLEEGRLQARFRHPGLVRVTAVVSEDGVAGLIMDYLEGEDLSDWLAREGPATPGQAATWMLQALDAIGYAHAQGVVHRDLKPSNLYLERSELGEHVRVLDFGVAKVMGRNRTRSSASIGTCAYMAPEQVERPLEVDHRTDVFALGAVLYEMVTNREAFGSHTDFETMQRIVVGEYDPPQRYIADLPPQLAAAISTALSVDPAERFQDCATFATALRPLATHAPPSQAWGAPWPRSTGEPRPPTPVPPTMVTNYSNPPPPPPSRASAGPVTPPSRASAGPVTPPSRASADPVTPPSRASEAPPPPQTSRVGPPPPPPRRTTPEPPPQARITSPEPLVPEVIEPPQLPIPRREPPPPSVPGQRQIPRRRRRRRPPPDRPVMVASMLQLFSGVLNLLVMWLAGCFVLGSGSVMVAQLLGAGDAAGACACFGVLSFLLFPLGIMEIVAGLQGLTLGRYGRPVLRLTAALELLSLFVGGLASALVGAAALLILTARTHDDDELYE